jgi:hypothetical protein
MRLCGLRGAKIGATDLAAAIQRRFPGADPNLEADLVACEEAAWGETANPKQTLRLLQILYGHQEKIIAAQKSGGSIQNSQDIQSKQQERAS